MSGLTQMKLKAILQEKRAEVLRIAKQHGAKNIRVFGSVARGSDTPDSDIDFLVELEPGRSLLDLGGLLMDLQGLFGRKVDVVTEKGLHWFIKDKILEEARPL
jgi:hypothetical protein